MKLKHLEMVLQRCEGFERPRASWEQYQTPSPLASRLLFDAFSHGDIGGKTVVDLGCGTGILAIGAMLLGARSVVAVDIDPSAIRVAEKNAGIAHTDVSFIVADIHNVDTADYLREKSGACDTVVMNPPFGAQKQNLHADRPFIDRALALAPVTYGIFNTGSVPFVDSYIREKGKITSRTRGTFPLKRTFSFHTSEIKEIEVEILRIERR